MVDLITNISHLSEDAKLDIIHHAQGLIISLQNNDQVSYQFYLDNLTEALASYSLID